MIVNKLMFLFFFFKQKTAYEMLRSLVGSEMCIRDSNRIVQMLDIKEVGNVWQRNTRGHTRTDKRLWSWTCLLYTSDAADDLLCVDLGGRRIITKKNHIHYTDFSNFQTH